MIRHLNNILFHSDRLINTGCRKLILATVIHRVPLLELYSTQFIRTTDQPVIKRPTTDLKMLIVLMVSYQAHSLDVVRIITSSSSLPSSKHRTTGLTREPCSLAADIEKLVSARHRPDESHNEYTELTVSAVHFNEHQHLDSDYWKRVGTAMLT